MKALYKMSKNNSVKFFILLLVFMSFGLDRLYADMFDVGVQFDIVSPQAEFRDNVGREGYGISGEALIRLGQSPLKLGLHLGWAQYGSEKRKEPISMTIPDVTVDVETDNNISHGHFLIRLQPDLNRISPYFDGLLGFHYLYTETSIKSEEDYEDKPFARSTNIDDLAFSYGFGCGVMIKLHSSSFPNDNNPKNDLEQFDIFLDLKFRYLLGTEADYLKKGSIKRELGNITYIVNTSRTDLLLYQIGLVFQF